MKNNLLNSVYSLLDEKLNPYYIGITNNLDRRYQEHSTNFNSEKKERNHKIKDLPKYRKARKIGRIIMQPILVNILHINAVKYEEAYIKHFKLLGYKLYNLTEGGDGRTGYVTSIETKHRISNSKKGISWGCHTEETKQNISKSHSGKKFTLEHKKNLSIALKNRIITKETRKRMSISTKGKINIKKYILISPDGKEHITNEGLTKFCEEHNISSPNMHKVLNGERKHHKRWMIRRYNNDN